MEHLSRKPMAQSSIEFYIQNLIDILGDDVCNKLTIDQTNKIHNLGNQAVKMHKQEIENAYDYGFGDGFDDGRYDDYPTYIDSTDYYNKTFKP